MKVGKPRVILATSTDQQSFLNKVATALQQCQDGNAMVTSISFSERHVDWQEDQGQGRVEVVSYTALVTAVEISDVVVVPGVGAPGGLGPSA